MAQTYRTTDGDMIDEICLRHYGSEAMTVAVYEANPWLSKAGPVLDRGRLILLPDQDPAPVARPIRLWGA